MQYTPEQQAAIETRAPALCVDAGAGSGKTRVLIDRIVHLIEVDGVDLGHVVAITFTDRAAAEMKERLRRAFHKRATDDREGMDRWRRLERQAEHARISTIHTFCGALLRENALHLGLDPEFTVLDENQNALLLDRVIRDTLHRLLEDRDEGVFALTEEFPVGRIAETLGSMLRRRFLLDRVADSLPVDDPRALEAVWDEHIARIRQAQVEAAAADPQAAEFHATLRSLAGECRSETDRMGVNAKVARSLLDPLLAGATAVDLDGIIAKCRAIDMRGGSAKSWTSDSSFAEVKESLKAFRDWVKDRFPEYPAEPGVVARSADLTIELFRIYREIEGAFAAEKARIGGLGFDDIILKALHALRDNPGLRTRMAQSVRFLLIDEFQDTDGIQLELAELLAKEEGGPSLFIVGDAKQSIYYFRGAEVDVFAEQRDASTQVIPMRKNFRTQAGILAFINEFFHRSGLLHEVEPEYGALEAHRRSFGPQRVAFLLPEMEEEDASAADKRGAEAELVARQIKAMCSGGVSVEDEASGEARPAGYGDVALLFRGMGHVEVYEAALRREGVPYALVAGGGFYTRQEVVDLLNLLKVVVDPWDEMALLGVLRSPIAGMTDDDITALALGGGLAATFYSDAIPPHLNDAAALAEARELLAQLRERQHGPLCAFLQDMLDATQYEAVLLNQYLGLQKASNVRKIVTLGAEFAQSRTPSLREFVHFLENIRAQETVREGEAMLQPEDRGAVTIMTIHKSKGLEFPVVVLPQLGVGPRAGKSDDLPLHRNLGAALRVVRPDGETALPPMGKIIEETIKSEEAEERARILYVAMTRARDYLVLSGASEPDKNSYMAHFNGLLKLDACEHGQTVRGQDGDWEAIVLRELPEVSPAQEAPGAALPSWPEAAAALETPLKPGPGGTLSISKLLDLLTTPDGEADDEPGPPAEEPAAERRTGGGIGLLRGALVHRLLEIWDGTGEAPIDRVLREYAPPLGLRHRLAEDLATVAEKVAALPEAERLWGDGCEREVPFVLPLGGMELTGIVDAVLEDHTIADFKTGRFDPARHERYCWQLRLYALALARCRGVDAPEGWLVYVDEGRTERIPLDGESVRATETAVAAALERAEP